MKVWQDDVMMFRTLMLYVLAVHTSKAQDEEGVKKDSKDEGWKKILLALEQPQALRLDGRQDEVLLIGAYTWLAPKECPLDDKKDDKLSPEEEDAIEKLRIDDSEEEADDEAEKKDMEVDLQQPPGNPEEPQDEEKAIRPQEPHEAAQEEVDRQKTLRLKSSGWSLYYPRRRVELSSEESST
eukprot:s1049_g21.t1